MEEFGWAVDAVQFGVIPDRLQLVSGRIEVGYEEHRGRVATGVGYDPEDDWTGALPRADRRGQSNHLALALALPPYLALHLDRKSTRLNSSHVAISYAVFCLKKKKKIFIAS